MNVTPGPAQATSHQEQPHNELYDFGVKGRTLLGNRSVLLDGERPLTARGLFSAIMLAFFVIVGLSLLVKLKLLLVLVFVSILIATSLAGPVRKLQSWGLPRSLSILSMFLVIALVVAGISWFALPPLIGQFVQTVSDLPNRAEEFERLRVHWENLSQQYPILNDVQARLVSAIGNLGSTVTGWAFEMPALLMYAIFIVTSLLTLSFLMLTSWGAIKDSLLRLIAPEHRRLTDHVLTETGERIGSYFRAKIIVMVVVGAWMYVTLKVMGSPIAMLIAIFAAICEFIPRIGPLFGRLVIVAAVLPLGWKAVVIAFISHTVIDNIKGSWLSPIIEGKQLNIHPLTAFIAVIAGGLLLSWMGALIAVPVAASIQVVIEEVVVPWRLRQLDLAESVELQAHEPPGTS